VGKSESWGSGLKGDVLVVVSGLSNGGEDSDESDEFHYKFLIIIESNYYIFIVILTTSI